MPAYKPYDVLCQIARNLARVGVYNEWAQQSLVRVRPPPRPVECTPLSLLLAQA
jgi:hypothetical protein